MQGGTVLDAPPYALRATPRAARVGVNPSLAAGLFATLLLSAPLTLSAEPRPIDLVVRHGTVVTVDATRRVIPDGAVAVEGGRIVGVGTAADIDASYRARGVVDASGNLVIPGLINAHGHAPMVMFRGVADDLRLMDWLTKYIFPAEAKNVSAPFVKTATRLAALEMIRS